jgi:hypothetical protein
MASDDYNYCSPYFVQNRQNQEHLDGRNQYDQRQTNAPYYTPSNASGNRSNATDPHQYSYSQSSQYGINYGQSDSNTRGQIAQTYNPYETSQRRPDVSASSYGQSSARPYSDTGALGSLAYASSLSREATVLEQSNAELSAPSRTSSGPRYVQPSGNANPYNPRPSSGSLVNRYVTSQPSYKFQSPYATSAARNNTAQSPLNQHEKNAHSNKQMAKHQRSGSSSQHSALSKVYSAAAQNNVQSGNGASHGQLNLRRQDLQAPALGSGQSNTPTANEARIYRPASKAQVQRDSFPQRQEAARSNTTLVFDKPTRTPTPAETLDEQSRLLIAPPVEEQQLMTVDPNQVFNEAEFQKRRAELETASASARALARSAAHQALLAAEASTPTHTANANKPQTQPAPPQPSQSEIETLSKEAIEAEMRAMIEKMQRYKSINPAAFSEVWEQVKKVCFWAVIVRQNSVIIQSNRFSLPRDLRHEPQMLQCQTHHPLL